MRTSWHIAILATAVSVLQAEPVLFRCDFNKPADLSRLANPEALELRETPEGVQRLFLPGDRKSVELAPIPVRAGVKYKLSLLAQVDDDFVVELNDRAHHETLRTHARHASRYAVRFLNSRGEPIRHPCHGAGGFVLTANPYRYVAVFYTPPETEALQVVFTPNRFDTFVGEVRIEHASEEPGIAPNPDFRYGDLNYCGWRPYRDGRLVTRPDGKTILKPGYGGSSPAFPLSPDKTYQITATGIGGGTVNINYFNAEGKSIHRRFLLRPTAEGVRTELTPPENTAYGSVYMYGIVALESLRVEPVP